MFLDSVIKRNSKLVEAAFDFYNEGYIEPNTYILDLDNILENAKKIKAEADKVGIDLFFMTKQIGRNPYVAERLIEIGYKGAVVVDFEEAQVMIKNNIPICNVGHLVQIPSKLIKEIVDYGAEYITVYSIDKIKEINEVAQKINKKQKIILRVLDDNDIIYSGQAGGFYLKDIDEICKETSNLTNVDISGLTTFPCFLFNEEHNQIEPTKNIDTLKKFKKEFEKRNVTIDQLNMPSATCANNIRMIHEFDGTQGEPGHALTGTTPDVNGVEKPAILYISEISHNLNGKSYCYAGGYYRRGHLKNALVGTNFNNSKRVKAIGTTPDSIDYYIELNEECTVGNTVLMAFRTQIFVTRSKVAIIEGINSGNPKISRIYNSIGDVIKNYDRKIYNINS